METRSREELRQLCKARGLRASGAKRELIALLTDATTIQTGGASIVAATASPPPSLSTAPRGVLATLFPRNLDALALHQLQQLCQKRSLAVDGDRDELVKRLLLSDPRSSATQELVEWCRAAGWPTSGTRAELVARVMQCTADDPAARDAQAREREVTPPQLELERTQDQVEFASSETTTTRAAALSDSSTQNCFAVVVFDVDRSTATKSAATSFRIDRVYPTQDAANARMNEVFYGEHPRMWTPADFEHHRALIRSASSNEMVGLSVKWRGHTWKVVVLQMSDCQTALATTNTTRFVVSCARSDASRPASPQLQLRGFYETGEAASADVEKLFAELHPWPDAVSETKREDVGGLKIMTSCIGTWKWQVAAHFVAGTEASLPIPLTTVAEPFQPEVRTAVPILGDWLQQDFPNIMVQPPSVGEYHRRPMPTDPPHIHQDELALLSQIVDDIVVDMMTDEGDIGAGHDGADKVSKPDSSTADIDKNCAFFFA